MHENLDRVCVAGEDDKFSGTTAVEETVLVQAVE